MLVAQELGCQCGKLGFVPNQQDRFTGSYPAQQGYHRGRIGTGGQTGLCSHNTILTDAANSSAVCTARTSGLVINSSGAHVAF